MTAPALAPLSPDTLNAVPTPELESELLTLAGHVAAAQCRFLRLLAEFDRRAGWAGPGIRSCAHWLSWRAGMSLRTASEHVRVARALTGLPAVSAAFATGSISFSKVRAITRLLDGRTARTRPNEPPGIDRERDDDTGDGGASDADGRSPSDGDDAGGGAGDGDPPTTAIPELAEDAEQALLDIALNGTASHVEAVVRAARRRTTDPFRPAALRGVSWRWADDGSLILRGRFAPADGAALVAAIESLVPAPPAASYDDPPEPEDWQQQAREQEPGAVVDRVAARRADAVLQLVTRPAARPGGARADGQVNVVLHLDVDPTKAADSRAEILAGPEIPRSTAERLACDARVQVLLDDKRSNRLYLGRRQRLASPAQIAALTVRDGKRCQFPGCSHTDYLHAHHIRHWLHGGGTDVDNLVLVCSFHHALIHDMHYRICPAEHGWRFLRPDGGEVPSSPEPLSGSTERLIESSARSQLAITRDGLTPSWGGERLDLEFAVDRLLPDPGRMAA